MGSAQAHTREEYDHIQPQWGSILKSYGDRWSNPLAYILVIYFQFFQCGTHVDYTLNSIYFFLPSLLTQRSKDSSVEIHFVFYKVVRCLTFYFFLEVYDKVLIELIKYHKHIYTLFDIRLK